MVKVEFQNPRYLGHQLREYMAEFIHYSKYAGFQLNDFHRHLSKAQLKPVIPDAQQQVNRIILETTQENLNKIQQLIESYPVFNTWKVRILGIKPRTAVGSGKPKGSRKRSMKKKTPAKSAKPAVPKRRVAAKTSRTVSPKRKIAAKTAKSPAAGKKSVKKNPVKRLAAKKKVPKKVKPAGSRKRKPKTRITVERVMIRSAAKKSRSAKIKAKSRTKKSPSRKSR
jgi:hypothetical protein